MISRYITIVLFLIGAAASTAQPIKRLYISNDDHTDYMWSGTESQYRDAFIKMLDYYIAQSDKTDALPSPYQSRFNCDGNFWLWEYERNKTPVKFQNLINKIKSGHISVPFNALASCYGAVPTEGILRGMYYAGYLERKFNLDLDLAVAMEDQTLPLGLGSLWAGAGAKYSWKGVCACDSKLTDMNKRNHEIYWYKGLDESAILMKWYALAQGGNKELGGYAEARDPALAVDELTALCNTPRYPYPIAGAFGHGWDNLLSMTDTFSITAAGKSDSTRQVIVSNHTDFFNDFEKNFANAIPQETVSYGNEWDLYSASMVEVSARVRRAVEKLRTAEALATLASLKDASFATGLAGMRRQAWMALGIYYEHDWTADGPITKNDRAMWQRKIENEITSFVDSLYNRSLHKLGTDILASKGKKTFYVFNPLSWTRTDYCDLPYPKKDQVKIIDISTNEEVPSQQININGQEYIRMLARDIPAVGYKVFEISRGKPDSRPLTIAFHSGTLENEFFRISLTSQGVITSLIDKTHGNAECVAEINGRYGNDLGAGNDNMGQVDVENAGPVSVTIRCQGKIPLAHNSRITLFTGIPRVAIENQITQNFGAVQSWAFSWNIHGGEMWHEESGAILRVKPQTEGGHYATRNARFDWLTLNHFAEISKGNFGITLSNADCSFFKSGNSALTVLDTQTPQMSVLAGGQVDDGLGIPNQGGDSLFTQRFAIGTQLAFDPAAAMRFSLEHQNPLVACLVTGTVARYPGKEYSFINISDPNVLLWSLKPAEDGIASGIIARVWNFGAAESHAPISFAPGITKAFQTSHVETDTGEAIVIRGNLREPIGHHQIRTFRILTGK